LDEMFGGMISSRAYVSLVLHAEIKPVARSVVHTCFAVSVSSNGPPKPPTHGGTPPIEGWASTINTMLILIIDGNPAHVGFQSVHEGPDTVKGGFHLMAKTHENPSPWEG
jgi:hypothetical protein